MRPDIIPPNVLNMIKFLKAKSLKCLRLIGDMDIGLLRPANIPLIIVEVVIIVVLVELDLGHKRPATLIISIV